MFKVLFVEIPRAWREYTPDAFSVSPTGPAWHEKQKPLPAEEAVGAVVKCYATSVRNVARRTAQSDEFPRRVIFLREWILRIGILDRKHLSAAHSPKDQHLSVHRYHPVRFVEDPRISHDNLDAADIAKVPVLQKSGLGETL